MMNFKFIIPLYHYRSLFPFVRSNFIILFRLFLVRLFYCSFDCIQNKPPDGNRGEQLKTLAIVVASSERKSIREFSRMTRIDANQVSSRQGRY